MRRTLLTVAALLASFGAAADAQQAASGPYAVLKTTKVGGDGGFDYVYADAADRRLYVPRSGANGRITVWDLDTFAPVGVIAGVNGHGAAVSAKSHHGFASSKPVAMWDTKDLSVIKKIDVEGNPDGIMYDPFNDRVWIFSHSAPNATVINAADGSIVGTVDLGGAPEQAATDGKGHLYVDIEDKANVAVVDAKTLTVTAHYDISAESTLPAGLSLDAKNHVLFVNCRTPAKMVILNADDGHVITSFPIGAGTDGGLFNPATMEAFSSNSDGTLSIVKENSPTSFSLEQTLTTTRGAKTSTLDPKTNHIALIAAEYGPAPTAPEPLPAGGRGGRGGRPPMIPDSFSIWLVGKP